MAAHAPEPKLTPKQIAFLVVAGVLCLMICNEHWRRRHISHMSPFRRASGSGRIGKALSAYHDANGCFPPAVIADSKGRPMHGWLVHLLPHLKDGHAQFKYNAYNFGQPHDSPANAAVADTPFEQFYSLSSLTWGLRKPVTHIGLVAGPGSIAAATQPVRLTDITDDPSLTAIAVEMARTPVPWASPYAVAHLGRGINLSEGRPPGASSPRCPHPFRWHHVAAWMADGQVRLLDQFTDRKVLRALTTIAGGEPLTEADLEKRDMRGWARGAFGIRRPGLLYDLGEWLLRIAFLAVPLVGAWATRRPRRWPHPMWVLVLLWMIYIMVMDTADPHPMFRLIIGTEAVVVIVLVVCAAWFLLRGQRWSAYRCFVAVGALLAGVVVTALTVTQYVV
jgi:uncharacterized protein DUF1559